MVLRLLHHALTGSEISSQRQALAMISHGRLRCICAAQTLKGNIRVFCRVRPVAAEKTAVETVKGGQPVVSFPQSGTPLLRLSTGSSPRKSFGHRIDQRAPLLLCSCACLLLKVMSINACSQI